MILRCDCGHEQAAHPANGSCVMCQACTVFHLGLPKKVSAVDHPAHYGGADNPYEVIKVLEAWYGEGVVHFFLCNAIKYIARAGKKDASTLVEDLKKARWYLDWAIARMEKA